MDFEDIHRLTEKYWNCETTLEEEQALRSFLQRPDLPEALKDTAALFKYFDNERERTLNEVSFEKNVTRRMTAPARSRTAVFVYNTMRIAAGIVVLILAVWLVRMEIRKADPAPVEDTYDDPHIAFEETKKALMMISKSFGTAQEQAKKINLFNEAKEDLMKEPSNAEL